MPREEINKEFLLNIDEDKRVTIFNLRTSLDGRQWISHDIWYYRLRVKNKNRPYVRKSTKTRNKEKAIEITRQAWNDLLDEQRVVSEHKARKIDMSRPRGNIECPSGVYEITNKNTGTVYVGISSNIPKRWQQHRGDLVKDKHKNKQLQRDWNKWGEWSFDWSAQFYSPSTSRESLEHEEQKRIGVLIYSEGKKVYNTNVKLLTE